MGNICTKEPKEINGKEVSKPTQKRPSSAKDKKTKDEHVTYRLNRNSNHNNTEKYTPIKTETEHNEIIPTDKSQTLSINPELTTTFGNKKSPPSYQKPSHTKAKICISSDFQSNETHILKFVKKHNREFEDSQLIETCLMNNSFMQSLDKQARSEIVKQMSLCFVQKDTVIFKQGMMGSYFYILKQGTVELLINEKVLKNLNEGENFGELALLYGAPRSGTIIAKTDCFIWVMERKNFRKIVAHITYTNYEENKKFIHSTPILSFFESAQKSLLCSSLYKEVFEPDIYIIKQGELASCMYCIREGDVDIESNGNKIRTLHKGDYFGEKSILIDSTRTMNAISRTKCLCFSFSVTTLKNMLGENYRHLMLINFIKSAFYSSKLFHHLHLKMIDNVFHLFTLRILRNKEIAFPKGYVSSSKVVVLIDGTLIKSEANEVLVNQGDILFENDLLNKIETIIDYSIIAEPDCLLVEADAYEVVYTLGTSFLSILDKSTVIESIQRISIFKNLTQQKLHLLVNQIQIGKYPKGKTIITQGEEGTKFFIVKKGTIDIKIDGKYIRTINQNDYLGERALFFKEPRSASAISTSDVEVYYLEKEDFLSCIEENMKKHLLNRLYLQDNTIELPDLEYIDTLGSGNYGVVALVKNSKNKYKYAIKCIGKKQIESEQLITNLELERSILLQIDHPFIVKLVKTLKDNQNIFFLMEYIRGKELFDVIRDIGLLNKIQTQFYSSSIMLAVEYLHERKIIYRDIKPENIIVCDNGYIKLIDFGTAKIISDSTSTVIGTPHYMAPEVILGEGYSVQVDYWSIAVCMFEFICGLAPFGESAEDPMEVYMAIINDQLMFPSYCKDKDFKQLITQMLCKNPLCRVSKLAQIKNQPWFQHFDWEALISLDLKPAVLPVVFRDDNQNQVMSYLSFLSKYNHEWKPSKEVILDPQAKSSIQAAYKKF